MKISNVLENEFVVTNDNINVLNEQVEKFWKLDSIGILQNEKSVYDINQEEIIKLDKGLLYIHPTAIMYVLGTIIDFTKDVAGSYLQINNPNATSQCGCGESFAYG